LSDVIALVGGVWFLSVVICLAKLLGELRRTDLSGASGVARIRALLRDDPSVPPMGRVRTLYWRFVLTLAAGPIFFCIVLVASRFV
jgi:hypothetical protein